MATLDYPKNSITEQPAQTSTTWGDWFATSNNVLPLYVAIHVACLVITCLAVLFTIRDFSSSAAPLYTLWQSWHRWDTGYYLLIAQQGYQHPEQTAFFPLYSIFIRVVMLVFHNPLIAGLIVSSIADLVALMVLYRLVEEDFDRERAERAILYLSVFPTAFFLLAAYNESFFLALSLLCFYCMRHGRWWLAGLFGLMASLTRSSGLLLLLPFCYEYLSQRQFRLRAIRLDVLNGGLIPLGVVLFGVYCQIRFHDFLAFSHAQSHWNRHLAWPWVGFAGSIRAIETSTGLLSFQALRNLTDLAPDVLVLVLILLTFIGPWRLPRRLWAYGLYAAGLYLFIQIVPMFGTGLFPLQSTGRFMLEFFPAFIILAAIGKHRLIGLSYLFVAAATCYFLLTQFLTGHWVL